MRIKGKAAKRISPLVEVEITSVKKATIAEISVVVNGTGFEATGSSWRTSGDSADIEKGQIIALYRAVEELRQVIGREVEKYED